MVFLMSSAVKKGDVVGEFKPWRILQLNHKPPLSEELRYCFTKHTRTKARPLPDEHGVKLPNSYEKRMDGSLLQMTVGSCLDMMLDDSCLVSSPPSNSFSFQIHKLESNELDELAETWPYVQHRLLWDQWLHLYREVKLYVRILTIKHPLVDFATTTLPQLNNNELCSLWDELSNTLGLQDKVPQNLLLSLTQAIEDKCEPSLACVLLDEPFSDDTRRNEMAHSCLPNCIFELIRQDGPLDESLKLHLVALYDFDDEPGLLVSRVDTARDVATRLQELRFRNCSNRIHECCQCQRCKMEQKQCASEPASLASFPVRDMVRLGHLSFQNENAVEALRWYGAALKREPTLADVSHAIGAVMLWENKFVAAQEHWKKVWEEQRPEVLTHDGHLLQHNKQVAHHYLDRREKTSMRKVSNHVSFISYFDSLCFVTSKPILDFVSCNQVIQWAVAYDDWTTSRHYAVPTNDIPVHAVPPLLEWFNKWMANSAGPLLAQQFKVSEEDLYVHDAFVVRYSADSQSRYLPVHLDESTHSFVLTLNSDFEGGGTYFVDHDRTISPTSHGTLVSFRGDRLRHGGNPVTNGVRYILTGFLYHDKDGSRKRRASDDSTKRFNEAKKGKGFSFQFPLG